MAMLERPEDFDSTTLIAIVTDLSRALQRQGKLAEAEEVAQSAREHALIYGVTGYRAQVALMTLGEVKLAQKAYAEAATILEQACDATAIPNSLEHLMCQMHLARALRHLPSYDKALVVYTRAVEGYGRVLGSENRQTRKYSQELDAFRAFLAKKEIWKAKCERTSLRIARALGTGQILANCDNGLSTSRRRHASEGEWTTRWVFEQPPHHHTTACIQGGCIHS
jgi:tetratricopeptide (TPR) repeat protein